MAPRSWKTRGPGGDDHGPKQTPKARWNGKKRVGGTCLLDGSRQEQTYCPPFRPADGRLSLARAPLRGDGGSEPPGGGRGHRTSAAGERRHLPASDFGRLARRRRTVSAERAGAATLLLTAAGYGRPAEAARRTLAALHGASRSERMVRMGRGQPHDEP